jgi:dTDP-4-amino-4,6-dideoxygalactose transaminase
MSVAFLDLAAMHAELEPELDAAWQQISRTGAFIGGEWVARFEADWAAYCGTRHCVGLANGTVALQLSLQALGVGPGDEVIVPANTFIATAAAVVAAGARPVFIDVDPATLLATAEGARAAITPRTAAIIAVHLYGQPVDMDALGEVAGAAGVALIEDAAQAHGATWRGRRAGGLARIGCFSFYPGKNLGAFGDAGAVVTDERALAETIRALSNHGRARDAHHRHDLVGGNHRLDGLQAAVLSIKLRRLGAWTAARRQVAAWYGAALEGLPLERVAIAPGAASSHHLEVVRTAARDRLREALAAEGIATGIHYPIPCHLQPAFAAPAPPRLPVAERAAGRILSLPMHPHLREADVQRVAAAIARVLQDAPEAHPAPCAA